MLTKGAIGNLVNRYKAVLKKCNLINTFGSLAVASMLVMGGAGVAEAVTKEGTIDNRYNIESSVTDGLYNGYYHISNDVTISNENTHLTYGAIDQADITLEAGKTLTLSNLATGYTEGAIGGAFESAIKNKIEGQGNLVIESAKGGAGIAFANTFIDVSNVSINAGGYGIYTTSSAGDTIIETTGKIEIISGRDAIHKSGSVAGLTKLDADGDITLTGRYAARQANTSADDMLIIDGKNVTLTGTSEATLAVTGNGTLSVLAEEGVEVNAGDVEAIKVTAGTLNVTANTGDVTITGKAKLKGGTTTITAAKDINITGKGQTALANWFSNYAGNVGASTTTLDAGGNVTITSDIAEASTGTHYKEAALYTQAGTTNITAGGDITIADTGSRANKNGVSIRDNGTVLLDAGGNIAISGGVNNGTGKFAGGSFTAMSGGDITIADGKHALADRGTFVLDADGDITLGGSDNVIQISGASVALKAGGNVTIASTGADGIYFAPEPVNTLSIDAGGDVTIAAGGEDGYGIGNRGNVTIDGTNVTITGKGRTALADWTSEGMGTGNTTINATGAVTLAANILDKNLETARKNAVLYTQGNTVINGASIAIADTSDRADKFAVSVDGGKLTLNSGESINITGNVLLKGGSAILTAPATTITTAGKGVILDASTLTVNGASEINSGLYGVDARNGSTASFNGNTTINTKGDWAYGALAWGSEVNLGSSKNDIVSISVAPGETPDDKIGLWAYQENGKINVTAKELNIAVTAAEGETAYGLLAQNTTYNEATTPATITIDANDTTITVASIDGTTTVPVGAGIGVMSDGKVDITGNIKISAKNAILARGNASAEVNVGAKGKTVQLDGDINFNWDSSSGTPVDANVNVILDGDKSYWTGNALVTWNDMPAMSDSEKAENLKVTGLNVTLSNGAVWNPTAVEEFDSSDAATYSLRRAASTSNGSSLLGINQLDMNGGVIILGAGVDAKADNLSGDGGSILMENADDLGSFSATNTKGNPELSIQAMKDGKILKAGEDGLDADKLVAMWESVKTEDGGAIVTASAEEGDVLGKITVSESGEGEQHDKTPVQPDPDQPQPEEPKPEEPTPDQPKPEEPKPEEPTPDQPKPEEPKPDLPKPDVDQERNTLMDSALQQATVTTLAIDKLLTNDVRKRLGDIRNDKNTTGVWMRWDGGKLKGDGLTNNFNTIQIGGDTKVAKNCRLGVAGSFTHGDAEFARGTAELEGFSLATYATWMGENGMFADVVARLSQFNNEMNVEGRKGKLDNRVFSLSGEYGWRFDVCDQFFVEPQAELAYTYVSSDSFDLGSAKYLIDSVDSLTGRLGVVAGWNLPDDRGNVYARASVLQQFMGDAKISGMDGDIRNVQKLNGEDTWLEYGIGANVKLNDKTYIWADVERTEGADIEEEWRGTVGIRYSF